jgi:hypothetical protein
VENFLIGKEYLVMKKTLTTAALSSVLVLGMASAAMAIHTTEPAETAVVGAGMTKITLNGSVRMRGMINKNNSAEDSAATTSYDSRVRLGVKAQVSPQATGYFELESNNGSGDTNGWGQETSATLFTGGTKGVTAGSTLTVLQAWVNYQPSNWGLKVGHMPLALGNKLFFDHTGSGDDAIVAYMNPSDNTHIAALAIKFAENVGADNSDDLDGYVALATHKVSDSLSLGANYTYLSGSADSLTDTPSVATNAIFPGLAMSNIGLTADGMVGPVSYSADVEFQFGDLYDDGTTTIDQSGYAVRLAGSMDLGAAKVGLVYGYGSGDDGTDPTDNESFVNFLTDTSWDVIIGNYRANIPGTGTQYSGLTNLSLYQVNASTKLTDPLTGKDLTLKGSISYMMLNEDLVLTSTFAGPPPGPAGDVTATKSEDSVGTEIDLVAKWALAPGLTYQIEAAYLFTGDAFNTITQNSATVGDVTTSDPDDLYFLRHSIGVTF